MRDGSLPCLCITGPTSTGKTDLALALAERVPIEVVSMDSAMVYRGLDVGTAKPTAALRARVPHHLIDILDPSEAYSAGRFAREARASIGEIHARGKLPVLVGGTLLYLKALRDGLAALPRADVALRAAIDREAGEVGWDSLHEALRRVDPEAAARIAPSDRQRIQRALEVHRLTGRPISELQRTAGTSSGLRIATVTLMPTTRAELGARIERRFDDMVAAGFVAEVAALRARGDLSPELPALRAVGYRQIWGHLEGRYGWAEARTKAIVATRQYAKRQLTWLKGDPLCEPWPAFEPGLTQRLVRLAQETRLDSS